MSSDADQAHGFARLEQAVAILLERHRLLLDRSVALTAQLQERERRIRELEEQLIGANQRRLDVGKRIDDLLAQVDQLDLELGARGG